MESSRRTLPLVPALAVAAVTVAALAAAWTAAAPSPRDGRPSLQDQPVQVVKAPPLENVQ
jgi:hypothetical protein